MTLTRIFCLGLGGLRAIQKNSITNGGMQPTHQLAKTNLSQPNMSSWVGF